MNEEYPLISAIMLVGKMPHQLIYSAIENFKSQTYPYKELIIINNAKTQFQATELNLKAEPDIFLIDTPLQLPTGAARNHGISAANGRILVQFDADCWHAPNRLESQIAMMSQNEAHISMLSEILNYSYNSGRASYYQNHKNMMLNTMMFIRPSDIDYSPVEKFEEHDFFEKLTNAGMKTTVLKNPELICKIQWSDDPIKEPINVNLSEEHYKLICKIVNNIKEN